MAWTTPTSQTAGNVLTAAFWNAQVKGNMDVLAPFGSAWVAYNSPTQSGWSLGNGTINAKYLRVGSLCIYTGQITFGSTTSISGSFRIGFPFASALRNGSGLAMFMDGTTAYQGFCFVDLSIDGSLLGMARSGGASAAAYVGSTTPFTWGTGDYITWTYTYEVTP